jgi:hypothetical protein
VSHKRNLVHHKVKPYSENPLRSTLVFIAARQLAARQWQPPNHLLDHPFNDHLFKTPLGDIVARVLEIANTSTTAKKHQQSSQAMTTKQ